MPRGPNTHAIVRLDRAHDLCATQTQASVVCRQGSCVFLVSRQDLRVCLVCPGILGRDSVCAGHFQQTMLMRFPPLQGKSPNNLARKQAKQGDSSEGAHLVWAGPLPEEAPALAVSRIHIPVATRTGRVKIGCSGSFESFLDFNNDVKF